MQRHFDRCRFAHAHPTPEWGEKDARGEDGCVLKHNVHWDLLYDLEQYRAGQNHGKQVLRISPIKFHFPIIQFVVITNGQRDLCSLPWTGEAAVQISWKKYVVGMLMQSRQENSICRGFVQPCTGLGKKVGPRLRESRLLDPSGCGRRVHAT